MAGPVFGDSYGDLSRNIQGAANARQAALAQAISTAVSALGAAHQHSIELQRLSQQQQQFGQQMDLSKSEQAQRKAESDRSYDLNKNYFDVYKDVAEAKKDQLTPAKQREHDFMLNQADVDASNGTFNDPDHVLKMYPALSPGEAQVMANRSTDARRQITSDFTTSVNAANVLNKHYDITNKVAQIDGATKELQQVATSGNSDQSAAATNQLAVFTQQKQKYSRAMQQIAPIATALSKDKNVQNLVTFDPMTERYVSTVPAPRWMTNGIANAPQKGGDPDDNREDSSTSTTTGGSNSAPRATSTTTAAPYVNQGPQEPTVKVRGRDGSIYNIPQSRVRDAVSRGGTALTPPPASTQQTFEPQDASMWMQ